MGTLKYAFEAHPAETIAQWQWGAFQSERKREKEKGNWKKMQKRLVTLTMLNFLKQPK